MAASADPAAASPAKLADDFNGDGYRDLAIGMPEKTINGKEDAGAVLVTFGSAHGLTSKHVCRSGPRRVRRPSGRQRGGHHLRHAGKRSPVPRLPPGST
ncbi:integrin alpha [Streptomyces collinus]|uniref:integrin alpha n=1 Tax=Streptomyces collinus TaxID=42684 RepID=UPI00380DDC41